MRIHRLDFNSFERILRRHTRYIDLDHVLQVSGLQYSAEPEKVKQDKDGIDYIVKSHGSASFSYQMAFRSDWDIIEIRIPEDRYEYEKDGVGNKIDAFKVLEKFKAEYEKFMMSWGGIEPVSG